MNDNLTEKAREDLVQYWMRDARLEMSYVNDCDDLFDHLSQRVLDQQSNQMFLQLRRSICHKWAVLFPEDDGQKLCPSNPTAWTAPELERTLKMLDAGLHGLKESTWDEKWKAEPFCSFLPELYSLRTVLLKKHKDCEKWTIDDEQFLSALSKWASAYLGVFVQGRNTNSIGVRRLLEDTDRLIEDARMRSQLLRFALYIGLDKLTLSKILDAIGTENLNPRSYQDRIFLYIENKGLQNGQDALILYDLLYRLFEGYLEQNPQQIREVEDWPLEAGATRCYDAFPEAKDDHVFYTKYLVGDIDQLFGVSITNTGRFVRLIQYVAAAVSESCDTDIPCEMPFFFPKPYALKRTIFFRVQNKSLSTYKALARQPESIPLYVDTFENKINGKYKILKEFASAEDSRSEKEQYIRQWIRKTEKKDSVSIALEDGVMDTLLSRCDTVKDLSRTLEQLVYEAKFKLMEKATADLSETERLEYRLPAETVIRIPIPALKVYRQGIKSIRQKKTTMQTLFLEQRKVSSVTRGDIVFFSFLLFMYAKKIVAAEPASFDRLEQEAKRMRADIPKTIRDLYQKDGVIDRFDHTMENVFDLLVEANNAREQVGSGKDPKFIYGCYEEAFHLILKQFSQGSILLDRIYPPNPIDSYAMLVLTYPEDSIPLLREMIMSGNAGR